MNITQHTGWSNKHNSLLGYRPEPPPLPVDKAPSQSQVDEPLTRRRLYSVPLSLLIGWTYSST